MLKRKLKWMILPLFAMICAIFVSSFTTESETPTGERKVDIICPWPSTKIIKGCVQGFSTCISEGNC